MRRKPAFVLLLTHLTIVSLLVCTIYPALATSYSPGVKAGDFVKYGTVSASFSSTDPSQTTQPQMITDFKATSYFRLDINSVSGNNVTSKLTQNFNNGTSKPMVENVDVQTGLINGTSTSSGPSLLIAGGLGQGDKISTMANAASINQTLMRTYAGASRDVNFLNETSSSSSFTSKVMLYFDKATGAVAELSVAATFKSGSTGQYTTSESFAIAATDTNLWSATILGLSPLVFYGIIGAIAAVVVIVAAVMLMKRRKPPVTPTPTTTGTATSPGP